MSVPPKPPDQMAAQSWEDALTQRIAERFPSGIQQFASYLGQTFILVEPATVVPLLDYLKLEEDFDYLVDLTAVDYPSRAERFEVVYTIYSYSLNTRVRIKTSIAEGVPVQSATSAFLGANWLEREVWDMFGIVFEGHPDLRRILLPDGWHGHPLRKDYSIIQMDQQWVQENIGIESGQ